MLNELIPLFNSAKENNPLIHCITNPISVNQCANTVLAVGGRPIMAKHPKETAQITSDSDALLINLGNITDVVIKSSKLSARTADKNNIPFIIDCVGTACSVLRRNFALKLIKKYRPHVIKGNYSEIKAIFDISYKSSGIDSDSSLDKNSITQITVELAKKYSCTILASGKTDIITDGKACVFINNGVSQLSEITGTGCMLGALTACFLKNGKSLNAAVLACAVMGISGELGHLPNKNASFSVNLIDEISSFDITALENNLNMEVVQIEKS